MHNLSTGFCMTRVAEPQLPPSFDDVDWIEVIEHMDPIREIRLVSR